jgi:hypothetical protein
MDTKRPAPGVSDVLELQQHMSTPPDSADAAHIAGMRGLLADHQALLPLVDRLVTFTTRLPLCCSEYAERDVIVRELEAALARVKGRAVQ